MARKHKKISGRMLFTWFILGGFILLLAPQSITNNFQFAFARTFKWPLNLGRNISLSATSHTRTDTVSRAEYERLQNHAANLAEDLQETRSRFQKLYGLHNDYPWKGASFALANIITATIDDTRSEIIIDCGQDKGISQGQYILSDNSIIGTICDVSATQAKVRLISDPASKLAAKMGEVNVMVSGSGKTSVNIKMLTRKHKIKVGEEIFAQKMSGYLDAPMKLGIVESFKPDDQNPLLWDITVKPACDLDSIRDAAVIILNPRKK